LNSEFENNESDQGGAVAVSNYDLKIIGSKFEKNKATKSGGALFLSCNNLFSFSCNFNITESEFIQNEAGKNGGDNSF